MRDAHRVPRAGIPRATCRNATVDQECRQQKIAANAAGGARKREQICTAIGTVPGCDLSLQQHASGSVRSARSRGPRIRAVYSSASE